jgi:hypothetical protein
VDAQIATVAAVSYVDAQDATKAPLASPALTGVPTAPTPTAGDNSTKIATTAFVQTAAAPDPSLMRGYIAGLTLSTAGSSTTFGVSAGVVVDSTSASFMKLASAFTKTTSAWAAGSGNGSLDTGGTGANTWYHVHAIKNPTTSAVDILTSLSATAPTLPSGYTLFRRIGSMRTNGGGQWLKFFQNGDEFLWDVPVADATALAITTTPSNVTLTVPPGVMVDAILQGDFTNSAVAQSLALVYSPNGSAQAAGTPGGNWTLSNAVSGIFVTNALYALTNTSAQVAVVAGSASNNSLYLITKGWVDSRGRYA